MPEVYKSWEKTDRHLYSLMVVIDTIDYEVLILFFFFVKVLGFLKYLDIFFIVVTGEEINLFFT